MQKVDKTDSQKRLALLASGFERTIRDVFIQSVNASKSSQTLDAISDLLEAGQVQEALAVADNIPLSIATSVNLSFTETAIDTSKVIATVTAEPVFFDQTNRAAVNSMRLNQGRLIREFATTQREAVVENITDGIRRGLNPRQQARNFRDAIGLTRHQTRSVNKFRTLLETGDSAALRRALRDKRFDPTVLRAIEGETTLSARQINRMVDRYRERFIKFRAETIGRTEALRSVQEANHLSFNQAVNNGVLDDSLLTRFWHVTSDEFLRDTHATMQGQERGLNEHFVTGAGNLLLFPSDPNGPAEEVIQCRCSVTTVFKDSAF